ncbi:MAG: thiamine pyrophosphate-dependent enzyme [Pseudomonadota bacterium]
MKAVLKAEAKKDRIYVEHEIMTKKGKIPKKKVKDLYRRIMTIRLFEEKVDELFKMGKILGAMHTSIGQEAVATGFGVAMEKKDLVLATHRGHGHCIMKGAELGPMMAEILGKAWGLCGGKGGSMHVIDVKKGMLGAIGIVGGGLPLAAGVGKAIKLLKTDQVCVCYFGDNASNIGYFHESLNVSTLWKLPVVYVCENNLYGVSVPVHKSSCVEDIAVKAQGYGIPGVIVDGMDVIAVEKAAREAIAHSRSGQGPYLVECKTYRFLGHSRGDPSYGPYRTKEEVEKWKKRDPRLVLISQADLSKSEISEIDEEVRALIDDAVQFAENSPMPDIATATEHIYA